MAVGSWPPVFDEGSYANGSGQSGSHSAPEMATSCPNEVGTLGRLVHLERHAKLVKGRCSGRGSNRQQRSPLRLAIRRTIRSADSCSSAFFETGWRDPRAALSLGLTASRLTPGSNRVALFFRSRSIGETWQSLTQHTHGMELVSMVDLSVTV